MDSSLAGSPPAGKLKMRLPKVFHRKASSEQEPGAQRREVRHLSDPDPPDPGSGSNTKKRGWGGSFRQRKKSTDASCESVPSTPLPARIPTREWTLTEQQILDLEAIDNHSTVPESLHGLVPKSPTSPSKKNKIFQRSQSAGAAKAEDGKAKPFFDYLGSLFGSGRKKGAKNPPLTTGDTDPASPSQGDTTGDTDPASPSQGDTTGDTDPTGQASPSREYESEGVKAVNGKTAVVATSRDSQDPGFPEDRFGAVGNQVGSAVIPPGNQEPTEVHVSRPSSRQTDTPAAQGPPAAPSPPPTPGSGEPSASESRGLNTQQHSGTSGVTAADLCSEGSVVKRHQISECDATFYENPVQNTSQLDVKDSTLVSIPGLTEDQYDHESNLNSVVTSAKECIFEVSEIERIDLSKAGTKVTDVEVLPSEVKDNSFVTLSQESVSLSLNCIDLGLNALGKPSVLLENEDTVKSNRSECKVPDSETETLQTFKRKAEPSTEHQNIPVKSPSVTALATQFNSSEKDSLGAGAEDNKAVEVGTSCIPNIDGISVNSQVAEKFTEGNLLGENQNGSQILESNTEKAVYLPVTAAVHDQTTIEESVDLSSNLNAELSLATQISDMDGKSPTETKLGPKKTRRRRSLKSDNQSRKVPDSAVSSSVKESLKETASNNNEVNSTNQSSKMMVKGPLSPKQDSSTTTHHKTSPKAPVTSEKSVPECPRPRSPRKKMLQRSSSNPITENKAESPGTSSAKMSNSETHSSRSKNAPSASGNASLSGQNVNKDAVLKTSESDSAEPTAKLLCSKDFNVSLDIAPTDKDQNRRAKCTENTNALDSEEHNIVQSSGSQTLANVNDKGSLDKQEPSDKIGKLKILKTQDSKEKSSHHQFITSQFHSTVTTKRNIPVDETEEQSNASIITFDKERISPNIRTEEEETIRITLPSRKQKTTSYRQVDFLATKDLPLPAKPTKKYVGSLKIQLNNKTVQEADCTMTKGNRKQPHSFKSLDTSNKVKVQAEHGADEMQQVSSVKAGGAMPVLAVKSEGKKQINTTSILVGNISSNTILDVPPERPEENLSLYVVSADSHAKGDVTKQVHERSNAEWKISATMQELEQKNFGDGKSVCEKGTLSTVEMQAPEMDSSKIEKSTPIENAIKQKMDINQGASDLALPLPNTLAEFEQKEMTVNEISLVNVQPFETTKSEVKDVPAKSIKEQEASLSAAVSEPVQQNAPKMQSQDTEVKDIILPQNVKTTQVTVSNTENIPIEIVSEKKLTPVPQTDGFSHPVQQNAMGLQDRDSEIKDVALPQTLELSKSTIYEMKEESHGTDANKIEKCSSAATEHFSQPEEQKMLTVQTVDQDIKETVSAQCVDMSNSLVAAVKSEAPTIGASAQKASLDATANELIPPLMSSTPKLQHKELEVKNAMKENFSSTRFAPEASSSKEQKIHLFESRSFALQSEIESQIREAEVKKAIVFQNPQTSEATRFEIKDVSTKECVDQSIILDSPEADFPSPEEQIQLRSQEEENMNFSSNETSNLDSSSDMESFTESIRKYGSPISLPQKKQRLPKLPLMPPFAMPPIQEDFIPPKETKTFDPTSFKFGLGKKAGNKVDAPSTALKKQQSESKFKSQKRASAEQSMVYKSLSSHKSPKLNLHGLKGVEHNLSFDLHSKRFPLEIDQPLVDESISSTGAQINNTEFVPSLVEDNTVKGFESDFPNATNSGMLPSYMEKHPKTFESEVQNNSENGFSIPNIPTPDHLEFNNKFSDNMEDNAFGGLSILQGSSDLSANQDIPNFFQNDIFNPISTLPQVPCIISGMNDIKLNPRPGKVVIYDQPNFHGEKIEVFYDVKDATSWKLPSVFSIRTVRGCWFLYQKPDFEGLKILLEEGAVELANIWGEEIGETHNEEGPTAVIGSIKRAVKDWSLSEIDLFTEFNGMGERTTFYDDIENIPTFGISLSTLSMQVHSGIWLVFEESFYHGNSYMVEPGEYSCPEAWGGVEPFIMSLKAVKMGGLKVENPNAGKIIVYEKPFFEGKQMELETDVFSFIGEAERDEESALCQTYHFETVGSIKVLGGLWVGYEKPGFEGHQYVLEEGEYQQCNEWGGCDEQLRSLRFIEVEASSPVVILFSETNFGEKGVNIEVLGPILNLVDTEYGMKTQSIHVLSGVWVAYEKPDFTGAQYVLEKGLYSSYQDWGAKDFRISSLQPVLVDANQKPKFKVKFFSEANFQGTTHGFENDTAQFMDGFSPRSCKVLSGNWVAYDGEDFTGKQYVLEEGMYPNLITMGCATDTHIKSSKTVEFNFTEPNIGLFAKTDFTGKKIELCSGEVNLALCGYNTHIFCAKVNGGTWIAYEFSNYRGCQILLQPSHISNWHEFTGWHGIGSVRPLIQKHVYFRIRNRSTRTLLTFIGELNDLKMVRVQALEPTGLDDQVWSFQGGAIKSKLAEECCLDIVGSLITSGSRLGVSMPQNKDVHLWRFFPDGTIFSGLRPHLAIDIKGGQHYDKNQTILNNFDEVRPTQRWDLEVL